MSNRHLRRRVAVVVALGMALTAASPVAAVGFCDPGRVSNHTTVTSYVEVSSSSVDDVRAEFRDLSPFVEDGSSTYAFVSLREDSNNYVRFGQRRSGAGNYNIFVTLVVDGEVIYDKFTYGPNPAALDGDPIDGDDVGRTKAGGGFEKFHRFTINHVLLPTLDTYFELLIDGTVLNEVSDTFLGHSVVFDPATARIGYEINDTGSQWWGSAGTSMKAGNIEVGNGNQQGGLVENNEPANANATLAWDSPIHPDQQKVTITDEDC